MSFLQNALDGMAEAAQNERSNYHLTLGELIAALEEATGEVETVVFDNGDYPTYPHSYRGFYQDLAFDGAEEEVSAGEFLVSAREALGDTFTGYKGGDFVMEERTPLWKAERGNTGQPVMDTEIDGDSLVLTLGEENY